jgi:hypothetical protein
MFATQPVCNAARAAHALHSDQFISLERLVIKKNQTSECCRNVKSSSIFTAVFVLEHVNQKHRKFSVDVDLPDGKPGVNFDKGKVYTKVFVMEKSGPYGKVQHEKQKFYGKTVKNPLEALLKPEVTFNVTKAMKRTWNPTGCQTYETTVNLLPFILMFFLIPGVKANHTRYSNEDYWPYIKYYVLLTFLVKNVMLVTFLKGEAERCVNQHSFVPFFFMAELNLLDWRGNVSMLELVTFLIGAFALNHFEKWYFASR